MQQFDVSVLITNYNHSAFLRECLDAVFAQSVSPREVLVIDDASTDNSIALLESYQKKEPRLTVIRNLKNCGPAQAMNRLIQLAKGRYLMLAAADDMLLPGCIEQGALHLEAHPDAGLCCSPTLMFHNHKPYSFVKIPISKLEISHKIDAQKMPSAVLHTRLWIPTNAAMYRRDLVLKYGCLDERLRHLCDWYLNFRIILNHGLVYVPHSFGAFRLLPTSYGAQWNRSFRKKIELYDSLFAILSEEAPDFRAAFRRSGALGLISADVLVYLLRKPSLWKFLPQAFYRKMCNFLRKLSQSLAPV